ncbi:hypothetical protein [Acetobacter orientalis]|uniref:Uncharacterized protein n=1 Tax=Acetobacter orientalis TaxID=146474 RepID=A0A0D6NIN9_9PROT|nr:hypothetical protein [Acetobacter orientalis]GAN65937.1 hypothetical protein Abor_014_102 [Acetobacter orientalis]GBR20196.1 hypothetical protein AA0481_2058 [Acetobacter orientalis NRIC 0481]GEL60389.1 hypothetical protein AOR02nite_02310 [Acetobacter orientalis]
MGPEELAIITNPQFINATFQAGENWYHGMVAQAREAARLSQERNSFVEANNHLVAVNSQLIAQGRQQNEKWKAFANDLVKQHDEYAVLAKRLLDEKTAALRSEVFAGCAMERQLNEEKARSAEKDVGISQLQNDLSGVRGTLAATQESLTYERQNVAALQAENEKLRAALSAAESDRHRLHEDNAAFLSAADYFEQKCKDLESDLERSQQALQEEEAQNLTLSQDFQNANLVNEALSSASPLALSLMEQTRGLWAAQGKPSMMENYLASHCRTDGQPLTVREYLWFATLMREMVARNIPDHLISAHCPVAERDDFLTRPVAI